MNHLILFAPTYGLEDSTIELGILNFIRVLDSSSNLSTEGRPVVPNSIFLIRVSVFFHTIVLLSGSIKKLHRLAKATGSLD